MKKGAANFLEKPLEENRVLVTLRGILREGKLANENQRLRQKLSEHWQIVGESRAIPVDIRVTAAKMGRASWRERV